MSDAAANMHDRGAASQGPAAARSCHCRAGVGSAVLATGTHDDAVVGTVGLFLAGVPGRGWGCCGFCGGSVGRSARRMAGWRVACFLTGLAAIYLVLLTRFEYLAQHMFF